ncbi:hypothetical protein Btru_074670 [Bulinus truncatus]|nr:hypothetical protein Btru_074670 [Bulinus truncatus]
MLTKGSDILVGICAFNDTNFDVNILKTPTLSPSLDTLHEMFIVQAILTAGIVATVSSNTCSYTSWMYSFDSVGQSKCQESNYYIRGFERNTVFNWKDDPISLLEGVECCSPDTLWANVEMSVVYADWTKALDYNYAWAFCPNGYYLQGLYRSDTGWPRYKGYLFNLENARCVKPTTHPFYYGSCYEEDTGACSDRKGRCLCKEGYSMTGLYRGKDDDLYNLDKMRCCSMADKPQVVDKAEELKEHIMDTTLWKMAHLADMLGYNYCYGNRGLKVGEDFEKNGNSWEASKKLFWPQKYCKGAKCDQRLNLVFGDWSIAVKDIKYGEIVIDDLKPETVDTGTIHNEEATPVTQTFQISKTVQETITHTTTSSWSNSNEMSFSLNFEIPKVGGASFSYTTKFEYSSSTSNENSKQTSRTFSINTKKTVQPFSSAKYNVIVSKTRTTIPYTAVMIAKFSTEFRGFMKYGGGYGTPNTNYHYQYAGNADKPTVNYKFGSSAVPFYTALKKESDFKAKPWLWNEVLKYYPTARQIIDSLTNETQYEFTLSGTLEKVAGSKIDVTWETLKVTRRDTPDGNTMKVHISDKTVLAVSGHKDPPAKVKYPVVNLGNGIPVEFKANPVIKNSA